MHEPTSTQADTDRQDGAVSDAIAAFSEYETVDGLVKRSGAKITLYQLRYALRFKETNELDAAVTKFGKRLYVHVPTFMRIFSGQDRGLA